MRTCRTCYEHGSLEMSLMRYFDAFTNRGVNQRARMVDTLNIGSVKAIVADVERQASKDAKVEMEMKVCEKKD